jgi:hypothetical protein
MSKTLFGRATLFLALLFVPLVFAANGDLTIYGYVTCSTCTVKGANSSHGPCMEKCLAKGAQVVIVQDADHSVIQLENPDTVKSQHGHRVALTGYMNGLLFHVISVRMI